MIQNERPTPDRMLHAIVGMQSELGELADLLKKRMTTGRPLMRSEVFDELGDLLYYVQIACDVIAAMPVEVMYYNEVKLDRRAALGKDKEKEAALLKKWIANNMTAWQDKEIKAGE